MRKDTAKLQQKQEKLKLREAISNKMLMVFSVGLISEIALLFIYAGYNSGSGSMASIMMFVTLAFLALFLGLIITSVVFRKKDKSEKLINRYRNWSYFSLIVSILSFVIAPYRISNGLAGLFGKSIPAEINNILYKLAGKAGTTYIMGAIGAYVIIMFIVYGIQLKKVK